MDLTLIGAIIAGLVTLVGIIASLVQIMDYVERRRAKVPAAPVPKYEPLTPLGSLPPLPEDQQLADTLSAKASAKARGEIDTLPSLPEDLEEDVEDTVTSADDPLFEEIEEYEKALELGFENADIWCSYGACLEEVKQVDKAIDAYSRALEIDPRHADSLRFRGVLRVKLGDWDAAIADFERLKLIPKYESFAIGLLAFARSQKRKANRYQVYRQLAETCAAIT
jgi:tetratricopeptide (TPR) repeat protein